MKKTRIFFGASLFALAVVGVFATKANTKINPYYYFDSSASACVQVNQNSACDPSFSQQCFYLNNSAYPMYAQKLSSSACSSALKHN